MNRNKEVVLTAVQNSSDHPTAELVLFRAREIMPSISRATVYRVLDSLAKEGKIRRVQHVLGDRFDKTLCHHTHFKCEKCGEFFDISGVDFKKALDNFKNEIHTISSIDFVVTGICNNCGKINN